MPPSVQRVQWWAWHIQGGQSQPSATQPPSRRLMAVVWALVKNRLGPAEVEDLGVAAEDDGDDPGGARQPSGCGGGDVFAGVEDPGLLQASE